MRFLCADSEGQDKMTKVVSLDDLHCKFRKRVPRMFADYCDSGSWSEQTLQENSEAFKKIHFRQRVLCDMSHRSTKKDLLGSEWTMPIALAPVGLTGMQRADGEILAARAAKAFGIPYTLSTMSICSLEDIAEGTDGHPFWFQLYMMKDRKIAVNLINRAKKANCSALVLTADLQVMGERYADERNGLKTGNPICLGNMCELIKKWRWGVNMLGTKRHGFGNILGSVDNVSNPSSLIAWVGEQFDLKLNWADINWIKSYWDGPLIVKGIMEVEDALNAVEAGADAIIVSNHGGRQLDGAPPTISILGDIVAAVGGRIKVFIDSGIRSGQDVLRALALGADAAFIGRPYIWGLGAEGEAGVIKVLKLFQHQLDISMAFCGITNISDVDSRILHI